MGRLSELAIAFSPSGLLDGAFHGGLPGSLPLGDSYLLKFALQIRGLRELHIGYSSTYSFTIGWKCPVPPSLKKLAYGGDNAVLLKALLRAHTATLEEVWLDHRGSWGDEVVDLLASIAHPWELQCPFVPGLDKLAKCRSLTSLRLTAQDRVNPPYIADAKKFLRLSSISRFYVKGMGEMVVDLVKTLGETGSPKLTRVEVDLLAEIEISRVVADVINQMPVYSAQKTEVLKHCDYLPSLKELIIGGERVLLTPRD
ncbi:hypothetical protein FOCC_FOCC016820 [Frankliniella occidentalis]|nr:hypothetical protein FOCC_FOCC016820 [Frankliniella occidentalis]